MLFQPNLPNNIHKTHSTFSFTRVQWRCIHVDVCVCVCLCKPVSKLNQLLSPSSTILRSSTIPQNMWSYIWLVHDSNPLSPPYNKYESSTPPSVILLMGWGLPLFDFCTIRIKAHSRFKDRRAQTYPYVAKYDWSHLLEKTAASCLVATFVWSTITTANDNIRGINFCLRPRQATRYLQFLRCSF